MITEQATRQQLIDRINDTLSEYIERISALNDEQINKIPYENSWTAGQLCNHVLKSTAGIGAAMKTAGKPMRKNSADKIAELQSIFLDVSNKFQSPKEIVPDNGPFPKQQTIDSLTACFKDLEVHSSKTNLDEEIDGGPLGAITKYELLHFVLYHSQRHLRQLKKICEAVAS